MVYVKGMLLRLARWGVLLWAVSVGLFAQPWRQYRLSHVAGTEMEAGVRAIDANFPSISALCYGPDGLLYVGTELRGLWRINAQGVLERVFAAAVLSSCAIAADGGIYVPLVPQVQYRAPDGATRTILLEDSLGRPARSTTGVAAHSDGGAFVADQTGNRIFRINRGGSVSVHSGLGGQGSMEAPPNRLAVGVNNRLYATTSRGLVVEVYSSGSSERIASYGGGLLGDIAVAKSGDIYYVAMGSEGGIYRVRPGSEPVLVIRGVSPRAIAVDAQDRLVYTANDPVSILRR